jgi:hypothetical protein
VGSSDIQAVPLCRYLATRDPWLTSTDLAQTRPEGQVWPVSDIGSQRLGGLFFLF